MTSCFEAWERVTCASSSFLALAFAFHSFGVPGSWSCHIANPPACPIMMWNLACRDWRKEQ